MISLLLLFALFQADQLSHPGFVLDDLGATVPAHYRTGGSNAGFYTQFKGRLYFTTSGNDGKVLYETDGQTIRPVLLPGRVPVRNAQWYEQSLWAVGGRLYFAADTPDQSQLWSLADPDAEPRLVLSFPLQAALAFEAGERGVLMVIQRRNQGRVVWDSGDQVTELGEITAFQSLAQFAVVAGEVFFTSVDAKRNVLLYRTVAGRALERVMLPELGSEGYVSEFQIYGFGDRLALVRGLQHQNRETVKLELLDPRTLTLQEVVKVSGDPYLDGPLMDPVSVVGDELIFKQGAAGFFRFNGTRIQSMEEPYPGFNGLFPRRFIPAGGGFYLIGYDFDRPLLYWFDTGDLNPHYRLLHAFDEVELYEFQEHPDGRLMFLSSTFGVGTHTLWASDGTVAGTGPLTESVIQSRHALGLFGRTIVFTARDAVAEWEPHVLDDQGPRLWFDVNQSAIDERLTDVTATTAEATLVLEEERVVRLGPDGVATVTELGEVQADALVQTPAGVFVLADSRRDLYRLTEDGLAFLARIPETLDQIVEVFAEGDVVVMTALEVNGDDVLPHIPRWGYRLLLVEDDGVRVLNPDSYLSQVHAVTFLDGQLLYVEKSAGTYRLLLLGDGSATTLLRVGYSEFQLQGLYRLGVMGETAWFAMVDFPQYQPPGPSLAVAQIYEVTPAGSREIGSGAFYRWITLADRAVLLMDDRAWTFEPGLGLVPLLDVVQPRVLRPLVGGPVAAILSENRLVLTDGTPAGSLVVTEAEGLSRYLGRTSAGYYFTVKAFDARAAWVAQPGDAPSSLMGAEDLVIDESVEPVVFEDGLFLVGETRAHGRELWRLAGGEAQRITDLAPGPLDGDPFRLKVTADGVTFLAPDLGVTGLKLYHLRVVDDADGGGDPDSGEPGDDGEGDDGGSGEPMEEPVPAVVIDAPEVLRPYRIGIARLRDLPAGAKVTWRIEGGVFIQTPQRDALVFKAGAGPELRLEASVIGADGVVETGNWTVRVVLP